jgi:hypothetical protein
MQIMDEQNSATMAIWLGKNLLGQRDQSRHYNGQQANQHQHNQPEWLI